MCTGIRVTADDHTVVNARTMEFGIDLQSEVIVSPCGFQRTGTTPKEGEKGLTWTATHASVGANAFGMDVIVDGLNDQGLSAGLFYFPGCAEYMPYTSAEAGRTIGPWQLVSWMLDRCGSVAEVRVGLEPLVVADSELLLEGQKYHLEAHFVVHDASGACIAVEYVGGKLHVHENPLGVITNAPTFDWHMTNLRNYVNYSFINVAPVTLGSVELSPFGQGSGMLGIPGDVTPPSRFLRAAAYSQSVLPSATGRDAVLTAFHILNNFDIPKGSAREREKDEHGDPVCDYTLWTSVNDLGAKQFYFRTHENSQIRMVDLTKRDLKEVGLIKYSMCGDEVIVQPPESCIVKAA
jgi:choloylglycine hydrolase